MRSLLVGLLLATPSLAAQGGEVLATETQKLTAPTVGGFGSPLDVDGDAAVLHAGGRAFVFRRAGGVWSLEAELVPSAASSAFGNGVAIAGDVCVVGDPGQSIAATIDGAAFVFQRLAGVWTQTALLSPSDAMNNLRFGTSVAVDGDRVLVGAFGDWYSAPAGAAYVFVRSPNGWIEEGKLVGNSVVPGDAFAADVRLEGDLALVTAPHDFVSTLDNAGSAFVFRLGANGWTQQARLVADDLDMDAFVGWSCALENGLVALGAIGVDHSGWSNAGALYLFEQDALGAWHQSERLVHPNARSDDLFGYSVDVAQHRILVGAASDAFGGNWGAGTVHLFRCSEDGWTRADQLEPADAMPAHSFGEALAFDGTRALIAAHQDPAGGPHDGAVYAFTLPRPPVGTPTCAGVASSTGAAALLDAWGSDVASANALTVEVRDLPPFQFGYLLASETQGFVQNPAGSQGNLCLGGSVGRFTDELQSSGPAGIACIDVDLDGVPTTPVATVVAGETWTFQYWYRDLNPGPTSNFSNGLAIAFL